MIRKEFFGKYYINGSESDWNEESKKLLGCFPLKTIIFFGQLEEQSFVDNADERGQGEILGERNGKVNYPCDILRSILLSCNNKNDSKRASQSQKIEKYYGE